MTESHRFRRRNTIASPHTTIRDRVETKIFHSQDLDVEEARICEELNCHLRFKVKEGYEMKDLPKFDDLTRYGVRENQELDLWTLEVRRLVVAVKSEEPPSLEGDPEWYGNPDPEGYNRLNTLAFAFWHSFAICAHDNEITMLEHRPQLANVKTYSLVHTRILRVFDPDEETVRYDRSIRLDKHHDEAYHCLVNYITATLARVLVRVMNQRFWTDNCISTVAKFAAKLKVVGADLPGAASTTIEVQRDFQMRMNTLARAQGNAQFTNESHGRGKRDDPVAKQREALQDDLDTSGARYFLVIDVFRRGIGLLLSVSSANLLWNEEFQQTGDIFETSAIIYDTGFQGAKTYMCQERDGAIGVAADRQIIRFTSIAFESCMQVWMALPSRGNQPGRPWTSIAWNRSELSNSGAISSTLSGSKTLTSMKEVITALVPYVIFCGRFTDILSNFTKRVSILSDPNSPVQYYTHPNILAAARVRTSQYEAVPRGVPGEARFQNVFDTDMAQAGAFAGKIGGGQRLVDELTERHQTKQAKFREAMIQVDKWIIDQKSIVISDVWYSWGALFAVGVLVVGALALVAVQDKVAGVDPSNLSVLVWTAAGFLMVYFKSRRVENWPWRDFLLGRVVCRSISEVQSVTKIDPQVLVAILLRYETRMLLYTRGPFNTLFHRKSDDGFAIDVPPLVETAIAGGHIFLQVESLAGPALVGLEAKSWDEYESIGHRGTRKSEEAFICRDFRDPGSYLLPIEKGRATMAGRRETSNRKPTEILPVYRIGMNELQWYRVRGVFVDRAVFA